MGGFSQAQHKSQAENFRRVVWLYGTADDIFLRGEGVAYNRDYGTAGDSDGERDKRVERLSTSNNRWFAGVLDEDVTIPSTGSIKCIINLPGSVCDVALGANTVIGTDYLTCLAGRGSASGRFGDKGFVGVGSVVPLQTVTALLESDLTGGAWSLAADGITLTVADTTGVSAGDTVVFLASEDEGSSKKITAGKYTVSSVTDATDLVLTASAVGATPGAALTCSGYIYTGNPTALCYLMEGAQSGLVTWVDVPNAGDTDYAPMVGGISYLNGGITLAADFDIDLPDGTIYGDRIGFILKGALTDADATVDLNTNGLQLDGSALAEFNAIDAANDACFLEWMGIWRAIGKVGGATEA